MLQRLSREVIEPATRKAPLNEYFHFTALATPEVSPFRAPNNDTLYSTAWLDLRKEPAILQMPDTAGRFYTAHLMDMDSDTIANIGQRVYGTKAAAFAVTGPGWEGRLPKGIKATIRCETVFAAVLLRVLVDGPDDVPSVQALQKQFRIASLSRYKNGQTGGGPDALAGLKPYSPVTPEDHFRGLDRILRSEPVRPGEQAVIDQFANIGIGPGKVAQPMPAGADILDRAYAEALAIANAAGVTSGKMVNGWRVMLEGIGNYGFDYVQRAAVWVGGPLANVPEESLYPSAVLDARGHTLDGAKNRYVVRFSRAQIPPVNAFWSLTMYRLDDGNLVRNPIDRYSIGNRTRGVQYGSDGSLTIYVQHESPGKDRESNWLPAPDGPFYMTLRLYGPKPSAISGEWKPPAIEPAE
jgi:hypothetical protein